MRFAPKPPESQPENPMAGANNSETLKLGDGRSVRVSRSQELEISAKAVFVVQGNREHRKLLEIFASGASLECSTASGIKFKLVT